MIVHLVLAGGTFVVIFILFLVVARTLNTIINQLTKLEYLMRKEYELKKEILAKAALREKVSTQENPPQGNSSGDA